MDSATTLALAHSSGYDPYALTFEYGQRHYSECAAAQKICHHLGIKNHRTFLLDLSQFGGSALTDATWRVPEHSGTNQNEIPITYVPARNIVFLSIALAWAESLEASTIWIGANAVDYSGYPDCRPAFIHAFEKMAALGTKCGSQGHPIHIEAPLVDLTKAEIIQKGIALGVDYSLTVSCYQADEKGRACDRCASCALRKKGFLEAGVLDPTIYVNGHSSF